MAALDFPSSPTIGQVYTANGKSWQWDGTAWVSYNRIISIGVTGSSMTIYGSPVNFPDAASLVFTNSISVSCPSVSFNGNTTLGDASGDTLTINAGTTTFAQGTANGVLYLNGSKVATSGSGLVFDGTNLGVGASATDTNSYGRAVDAVGTNGAAYYARNAASSIVGFFGAYYGAFNTVNIGSATNSDLVFYRQNSEQARITAKGLLVDYTSDGSLSGKGNAIFSGNVGIGTSSPGYKLHVVSGTAAIGAMILSGNASNYSRLAIGRTSADSNIGISASSNQLINGDAAGDLTFVSSGQKVLFSNDGGATAQLTLNSSGNLGLGVTPSAWGTWSSVLQGNAYALTGYNVSGNVQAALWCNSYRNSGGTNTYYSNGYATQYLQASGAHQWYTAPSGTAGNPITFTQAMTLSANAELIIDSGTSGGRLTFGPGNTYNQITSTTTGFSAYNILRYQGAQHQWLNSSSSQAMTLDASGNLLVGVTALYGTGGISLDATGYEGTGQIRFNRTTRATISYPMDFRDGGTAVGYISYNNTATTYNTSSDQRLKTNVTPAESAVQSILDFPVDQFDWISDGSHADFGAVAQKAINVIPEMVSVPADPDEMWGIDWSKAVPRLIRAYQELHARLEQLEAR